MISIKGPINSGAAAGSAGSATNNADSTSQVVGKIVGLYIRYNDSPPAGTTDVTIATKGNSAPAYTILKISNAATNGYFVPRHATVSNAGAGNTADYADYAVNDVVNVLIEGANASDSADVWLFIEN